MGQQVMNSVQIAIDLLKRIPKEALHQDTLDPIVCIMVVDLFHRIYTDVDPVVLIDILRLADCVPCEET